MRQIRKYIYITIIILLFLVSFYGCAPGPGIPIPLGPAEIQSIFFAALVGIGIYIALKMREEPQRKKLSTEIRDYSESEEIIKQRYTRGEITREQYLRMIEDIRSQ
ncbi:MAG: hypothetical protein C4291_00495 [Candidatus Dadabacteria bacterium]